MWLYVCVWNDHGGSCMRYTVSEPCCGHAAIQLSISGRRRDETELGCHRDCRAPARTDQVRGGPTLIRALTDWLDDWPAGWLAACSEWVSESGSIAETRCMHTWDIHQWHWLNVSRSNYQLCRRRRRPNPSFTVLARHHSSLSLSLSLSIQQRGRDAPRAA